MTVTWDGWDGSPEISIRKYRQGEDLFVLRGAEVRMDAGQIKLGRAGLRDFEHDPAYLVYLSIYGLAVESMSGPLVYMKGMLHQGRWYDPGTDISTIGDRDSGSVHLCDYEWCKDKHYIFPFLPPERISSSTEVEITVNFSELKHKPAALDGFGGSL